MSRARELSRVGSLTGISTITGVIHADQTNNRFKVGAGVTITTTGNIVAAGIITAASFVGDGSGITNAGSTLSAGSGSQRVVLTSQTTGAMTATATNSGLTFESGANALTIGGGLSVGAASTIPTLSGTTATFTRVTANGGFTGSVNATGVSTEAFLQATTVNVSAAATVGTNLKCASFGVGTDASGTTGEIRATNDITAFYSSDARLKDNVTPIDDPLAKVLSISGNTFEWKEGFGEYHSHEGEDCGVIAQEIEALGIPGLVTTRESGYKAVKYEKLTALLIEAVKELSLKVQHLEERCNCGQQHN